MHAVAMCLFHNMREQFKKGLECDVFGDEPPDVALSIQEEEEEEEKEKELKMELADPAPGMKVLQCVVNRYPKETIESWHRREIRLDIWSLLNDRNEDVNDSDVCMPTCSGRTPKELSRPYDTCFEADKPNQYKSTKSEEAAEIVPLLMLLTRYPIEVTDCDVKRLQTVVFRYVMVCCCEVLELNAKSKNQAQPALGQPDLRKASVHTCR